MSSQAITRNDLKNILNEVLPSSSTVSTWQALATSSITLTKSSGNSTAEVTQVYTNNDWLVIDIAFTTTGTTSAGSNIWFGSMVIPYTKMLNYVVENSYFNGVSISSAYGGGSSDTTLNVRALTAVDSSTHEFGVHFRIPVQK